MAEILHNSRARRDYHILETFEAGIVLHGSEVKALRAGKRKRVFNLRRKNAGPQNEGRKENRQPRRGVHDQTVAKTGLMARYIYVTRDWNR